MAVGGGSWIRVNAGDTSLDARTLNREIREILGHKAESITKDPELRQYIGNMYISVVTQYVPKDTGKLRASGRATEDGRVYWTAVSPVRVAKAGHTYGGYNYADIQYEPEEYGVSYHNYTTPGTTSHWTDMIGPGTAGWAKFIDLITPEIKRRLG